MPARLIVPLACAALGLGLAACGGGGGSTHALGEKVVVKHTEIAAGANAPTATLGITVLGVRKGTQDDLKQAGFRVDPEDQNKTPYYVDARFENRGAQAIKRNLDVSLEDQDDNLINSTVIFNYGGRRFDKCPDVNEGQLAPGKSYEGCTLFLVAPGREPSKVSFLPHDPGKATDFVYWEVE